MKLKRTAHRIQQNRAYNKYRRETRYLGVNCYHKPVKVECAGMADPYFISQNELNLFHDYYFHTPGVKVTIEAK